MLKEFRVGEMLVSEDGKTTARVLSATAAGKYPLILQVVESSSICLSVDEIVLRLKDGSPRVGPLPTFVRPPKSTFCLVHQEGGRNPCIGVSRYSTLKQSEQAACRYPSSFSGVILEVSENGVKAHNVGKEN